MFIAYNNNLITEIADTLDELLDKLQGRVYNRITETDKKFVRFNNRFVLEDEYAELVKEEEKNFLNSLKVSKKDFFMYVIAPYEVSYSQFTEALKEDDTLLATFELSNVIARSDEEFLNKIKDLLKKVTGKTIKNKDFTKTVDTAFKEHNIED